MSRANPKLASRGGPPGFALLLPAAAVALVLGTMGGLARIGVVPIATPSPAVASHGPLLVFGFLGVLVAVERAVALRRAWAFTSPLLGVAGAVALVGGASTLAAAAFVGAAGIAGAAVAALLRRNASLALWCMLASCAVWLVGVVLWATGAAIDVAMPWWAAFLVLMIVGERIQFGRLADAHGTHQAFTVLFATLAAGLACTFVDAAIAMRIIGAAFIGLATWLLVMDVLRRARRPGLLWFVSVGLACAQLWLAATGVLWLAVAPTLAGPAHDAAVHALFQGFVMGMVLAHAPMIFPAVTGLRMPFHRVFHVHLALLHVGLVTRVAGDLTGDFELARRGSIMTAVALGLFLMLTLGSTVVGRIGDVRGTRRDAAYGTRAPATDAAATTR